MRLYGRAAFCRLYLVRVHISLLVPRCKYFEYCSSSQWFGIICTRDPTISSDVIFDVA